MTWRRWRVAAVAAACGLLVYWILPPNPIASAIEPGIAMPVRGVIHVHTRRSDGTGTIEDVAASAARANLQFVIITDHGNGTRRMERPEYRSGVLCIDAAEISTDGGHVVVIDLPTAPYPLGGEARDVIEDVRRLGGLSIVAHPDSPRPELRWTNWDAPFDGLEWLNGDSQWRDEGWLDLGRALLTYPLRRTATLTALLDKPEALLTSWDAVTSQRPVVALAGSDAHARLGSGGDPYGEALSLRVPSYEQIFRTFSIALPDVRLTGSAGDDARLVINALRRGQVYSSIDGLAGPAVLAFSATSRLSRATLGGRLTTADSVEFRAETNAPQGTQVVLVRNGQDVASSTSATLVHSDPRASGAYRIEIRLKSAPGRPPVPWVLSNPIYVGMEAQSATISEPKRGSVNGAAPVYSDGPATDWRIERNPESDGALDVVPSVDGTQLSLRFAIGGLLSKGPYVAAVVPTSPALTGFDRLTFTGRAVRPMRVSVQLRRPDEAHGLRWRRSVFLDEMARTITIFFDDMTGVGSATGSPVLSEIRDLLVVVDTVNTEPGSNGQIWLDDMRYER